MRNEAQVPAFLQKWKSNDPRSIQEKLGYDPFENEIPPPVDEIDGDEYLVIGTPLDEPGNIVYLFCPKTGKYLVRESFWDDEGIVTAVYGKFEPTK